MSPPERTPGESPQAANARPRPNVTVPPTLPSPEGRERMALAGREREERVRFAGLGVLLEALDDQSPGVVDRAEVVLGHGVRPLGVAEEHGCLAVFGGGEVPGDGRPVP